VGVTAVDVDYSTDAGADWNAIAAAIPNSGSAPWSVPNEPTLAGLVRVSAHDAAGNTGSAISASAFTIADLTAPVVTLQSPIGGESFTAGTTQNVTWTASDNVAVDSVNVDYSSNGLAGPWQPVAHGLANTGSFVWTVPSEATDSAAVRVTAIDSSANLASATSDSTFHIASDLTGVPGGAGARFALYAAVPSPSRGATSLRFSLAEPGNATLEVFNLSGRRVWGLAQPGLSAGAHAIAWSGVSDAGAALPSGIYFVRLTAGARVAEGKLVVLR
jgi:hypothetical protein